MLTNGIICGIIFERSTVNVKFGGIAQLARATGSYPVGHGFKSNSRYHRPVGQAAKTPPFHGGNGSSILPRVTKKRTHTPKGVCVLFLLPRSRVRRGVCAAYAGVRSRHSKIDKLACQAQSARIFAVGEILPALHNTHT